MATPKTILEGMLRVDSTERGESLLIVGSLNDLLALGDISWALTHKDTYGGHTSLKEGTWYAPVPLGYGGESHSCSATLTGLPSGFVQLIIKSNSDTFISDVSIVAYPTPDRT